MRLNKYVKFAALFFPLWILCSWAIYERMLPHYDVYQEREVMSTISLGFSFLLLAVTGVPSFLFLRKRDVGTKGKILIFVIVMIIASFLIPLSYSSYINKMRVQEYIEDLENLGFNVKYIDHFVYGRFAVPIWVDTYYNFTDIAKNLSASLITISAGVPYYFIFFFPRTIEMICAVPYNGYYILRIE